MKMLLKYIFLSLGGKTMSTKKTYMSLLKEAIAEFDTSDSVDVKGPMLDPILSWDGDGELPTNKDAASILERYYFNENKDNGIETVEEVHESKYQNDKGSSAGDSMKHTDGAGTEQAGTSDAKTIPASKTEKAKDIAKEDIQLEDDDKDDDKDTDEKEVEESEELEMENAIIEKLIAEMEEEDEEEEEEDDKKSEVEEAEIMTQTGSGPKTNAPKEKKATGSEDDTKGAGTEQAGTGTAAGEIPPRKDQADKMVKPKNYTDENAMIEAALAELEQEIAEQADVDVDVDVDDDEKELDVDKELTKEQSPPPSAVPGGPGPKDKGDDKDDDEAAYSEAFKLFKDAIDAE